MSDVLLALDTATPAVTVAVARGGEVLAESTEVDPRRHGELLAPAIDRVLAAAGVRVDEVDVVATGVGPGPFTGLRVGLVTARTLAMVRQVPLLGVCTLDHIALSAHLTEGLSGEFRVVTDARRREVYWAQYVVHGGDVRRQSGPHVAPPADAAYDGPCVGAGTQLYRDHFPDARAPAHPSAAGLARWVIRGLPTVAAEPMYLRRPDAALPGDRKRVS